MRKDLQNALLKKIREEHETKKADDQLRMLFTAMEQSPVSIIITGVDETIEYVNPQFTKTTGYSENEVIGRTPRVLKKEAHSEESYHDLWQSLDSDLVWTGDLYNKSRNGTYYWERARISKVRGEQNQFMGYVCVQQDITKEKEAQMERDRLIAQLEYSNKELENFAYIASHDLREPLRKVSSFGQILEESLQGRLSDDEKENLGFMIDGAKRLQRMIDDLLTYSRLTTEAKPFAPVDLNKVIRNVAQYELYTKLQETGGKIEVVDRLPLIYGDEFQMEQLLQNLLDNALKYRKEDVTPCVTIEARPENSRQIRICVRDNGIGIDPKYFNMIFNMFKRLHGRGRYEGTGLGLAICKKIVERHGGNIGVDSIPGQGTTIWFTIDVIGI